MHGEGDAAFGDERFAGCGRFTFEVEAAEGEGDICEGVDREVVDAHLGDPVGRDRGGKLPVVGLDLGPASDRR